MRSIDQSTNRLIHRGGIVTITASALYVKGRLERLAGRRQLAVSAWPPAQIFLGYRD
jgi:hypothetical protein